MGESFQELTYRARLREDEFMRICLSVSRFLGKRAFLFVPLLWVLSSLGSDKLQEHAERAGAAMQRNNFAEAEREYRAILGVAPQLAEMRSNLGLALHMQNKFGQAEKEFREALRANPKLFVPNYFLGIELFKTNRYKEAKAFLESALGLNPSAEVRYRLGETYVGLKEYNEAIRQYREILKQAPGEVDALYSIGKIYNELMQRSVEVLLKSGSGVYYGLMLIEALEAGDEWRSLVDTQIPKIIQSHPSVPILRYELGRLHLKDGKTQEARRLFQEELAVDPWSYKAHHGLAQIWLALGQYEEFNQELARAVAIRPEFFCPLPPLALEIPATDLVRALENCDSSLARQFLAAQLGRANSLGGELTPYRQKLAASDQDPMKSAEALFREKRYEAVISRLEKLATDKSSDTSQRLLLAQAFYETGKLESAANMAEDLSRKPEVQEAANYLQSRSYQMLAVQSLAELERIAPDSYRAHQLRGEAYFLRKNMPEAISAFKAAIEREPGDAELFYQLGRAHYYLGEFSQAFEALEKSLKLEPYNAEANFIIGEGMVHMQEGEKAIPFLQRALELDSSMLKARGELGKALLQMNRWESAAKELEVASDIDEGGEFHYQLFRAYSKLNQNEKAQRALVQSNKLRQEKIARERARIASREQSLQ